MNDYKHTQIGYTLIACYLGVLLAVVYLNVVTEFAPAAVFALVLILLAIASFATMTVQVDDRLISLSLGVGLIRKRYRLSEIERCRAVENPWYYFLGIRYTPRGWLFAVSGSSAVELEMKNGKLLRIGTDEQQKLLQALDESCAKQSAGH